MIKVLLQKNTKILYINNLKCTALFPHMFNTKFPKHDNSMTAICLTQISNVIHGHINAKNLFFNTH